MTDEITVALIGIGGYGNHYANAMVDAKPDQRVRLLAAADPSPASCRRLEDLKKLAPLYKSAAEIFESHKPDLTVIASPPHLHAPQICMALQHGSAVMCEKPICTIPADARKILNARLLAGRDVAIGYQWSFSDAVQQLKGDILAGRLGAPKRLRNISLWPRDEAYYGRSPWAGAQTDRDGNPIFDSPVANGCAHHLHNMLYVLGAQVDRSARVVSAQAELYRANPIENYDTAAIRYRTDAGVELLFYATHATDERQGPVYDYEFEKAVVHYDDSPEAHMTVKFADGSEKDYGCPHEARDRKFWLSVDALRHGKPTVCGIEASSVHTLCVAAAAESCPDIATFDAAMIRYVGDPGHRISSVIGLADAFRQAYQAGKLPSEMGLPWAKVGKTVAVPDL